MKVFKYIILYLLILQISLPAILPLNALYNYRMDYNVVKDSTRNIDFVIEKISQEVKASKREYIIILGDSVAFSGPGAANESIGFYLEKLGYEEEGNAAPNVYNLAMPAMQTGDIYTMLLKLEEKGISTDNLIFNVIYAGFVKRNPDPPPVFWLKDELERLDKEAFNRILPSLIANGYQEKSIFEKVKEGLWSNIALLKYKDVIKAELTKHIPFFNKKTDILGDTRPWYEKEGLVESLQQPEYLKGFNPQPFDMSEENVQIYFLNKILEHQQGKKTLVYIGGTNSQLMSQQVSNPGYQRNLNVIDNYFKNRNVLYINFQGVIDDKYFTDHVHLTGEGYEKMAELIYKEFSRGDKN